MDYKPDYKPVLSRRLVFLIFGVLVLVYLIAVEFPDASMRNLLSRLEQTDAAVIRVPQTDERYDVADNVVFRMSSYKVLETSAYSSFWQESVFEIDCFRDGSKHLTLNAIRTDGSDFIEIDGEKVVLNYRTVHFIPYDFDFPPDFHLAVDIGVLRNQR